MTYCISSKNTVFRKGCLQCSSGENARQKNFSGRQKKMHHNWIMSRKDAMMETSVTVESCKQSQ